MNRILQFLIFIFWGTLLYSQNIVVDGVTFSADRKTLISYSVDNTMEEYSIPEGIKEISESAFRNASINKLILPSTLNVIGDFAFKDCSNLEIVTWKNFPKVVGRYIFSGSGIVSFQTLEDSRNCIAIDGVLFSKDQKTLLCFPRFKEPAIVPEGTEIIGMGAFESGEMWEVVLPASIMRIEDNAFWMTMRIPTRFMDYICLDNVVCNALIPPTIIGNPFAAPYKIDLYVPAESFDIYRKTPYWEDFRSINGSTGIVQEQVRVSTSKVWIKNDILYLESEKEIGTIEIYNTYGVCIWNESIVDKTWQLEAYKLPMGLFFLKVFTVDGNQETFKLSN